MVPLDRALVSSYIFNFIRHSTIAERKEKNKQLYKYDQFKSETAATDRVMIVHEFRQKLSFTTHN